MRAVNVILLVLALALLGALAYFELGTDISVSASARRSGESVFLALEIENSCPLDAQWLAFSVVSPVGAMISRCEREGESVPAFSSVSANIEITGVERDCAIDIEYYMLGERRTAAVIVN